jgi:hypothetical protein
MVFSTRKRMVVLLLSAVTGGIFLATHGGARSEDATHVDPAALERTRDTLKMLDDMHKAYVVHITATYVRAQESTPAAHVAKKVYQHMQGKGWFNGRLIDASGKPFNEANVAKTPFEKKAVEQIKKGKAYYDEVTIKDGKPFLRAATIVPAVMNQCIRCHTGQKEGDLLGALVYEIAIR